MRDLYTVFVKLMPIAKALFLVAAFLSFLLSVGLYFLGPDKLDGIFVGIWVPSILALGALLLRDRA